MTFEFKDNTRHRRLLLITIGGVLAASAGVAAFTMASGGRPADVVKQAVLVAGHEVSERTAISNDDVVMREVPVDEVLGEAYTDPAQVVGRITSVPILPGQQITPNLFATSNANSDFSILGPGETVSDTSPAWRAAAVEIPPDRAVGGDIKAGDHVDLFISVQINVLIQDPETGEYTKTDNANADGFESGVSTKITFQDLEVLKATPEDNMYVLKVDLHQAEQLAHIADEAPDHFSIVLRPDEDTRAVDTSTYGTTDDRIIMTYLYPAPRLLDLTQLTGPAVSPLPACVSTPCVGTGTTPGSSPTPSSSPSQSTSPSASESPAPSVEPTATPKS